MRSVSDMFVFPGSRRHTSGYRDWSSDVCSSDLIEVGAPAQPHLAGVLREEVLVPEAVLQGEALRALAHEEDVIRVLEDELRHLRGRLDTLQRADRASALGWPVHAGGVELHHALRVGEATVAH